MTTAAFKSNSRRGNAVGGRVKEESPKINPPPKQGLRRSLSVNALSRATISAAQIDISSEFLNKRDNPLFSDTGGSPPGENTFENPVTPVLGGAAVEPKASKSSNGVVTQRGRSVARNSALGSNDKEEIGGRRRSLSRVKDSGGSGGAGRRGRSVSRGKSAFGASESDAEQDSVISATIRGRSNSVRVSNGNVMQPVSGGKASETRARNRSFHPSYHPSVGSALDSCEDGVSTSSLSEAEEKTIKAVYEQMKSIRGANSQEETASNEIYETVRAEVRRAIADMQNDLESAIRRNNTSPIASTDVSDIPPHLVNPGAVELVLDIRREYSKKLEESQERARKLRSDLAIEEHRGQELSRILKETLPDPKKSTGHRSRFGRKNSNERKKMSKRLTDEAMSYFDECVSISTFDSSDFSAAEDSHGCLNPNQPMNNQLESSPRVANSGCEELIMDRISESSDNTETDRKFRFSFCRKQNESIELRQDIRNYIKNFEKDADEDGTTSGRSRTSYYNVDGYHQLDGRESLLFDQVLYRNQIQSGSLHICGGLSVPFLPFANLI